MCVLPHHPWSALAVCGMLIWLSRIYRGFMTVDFLRFQWDVLALEAGGLAVLASLAAVPTSANMQLFCSAMAMHGFTLLCFKLMWGSCLCKLLSNCPEWNFGTAMQYHHRTTCLPKPWARTLHRWSGSSQASSIQGLLTLWVEGPLSLLSLTGWPLARAISCVLWCGLMIGIAVSGNYGFFNALTCVIATALLDDSQLAWLGLRVTSPGPTASPTVGFIRDWLGFGTFTFTVAAWALYTAGTVATLHTICRADAAPVWCRWAEKWLSSHGLAGRYGLFARMTTTRDEVIIKELHRLPKALAESAIQDGLAKPAAGEVGKFWVELALPYKPGPLNRAPPVLFTHMPRLDWQMWFVSLTWARFDERPLWFDRFLTALQNRNPDIIKLVEHHGQHPVQSRTLRQKPEKIQVTLEDYQYNDPTREAKAAPDGECGDWWCRQPQAQWLMGDIHDWASCRCQLCLASQRLLLLVCNEKLGEAFSRACVRKLREVYIELLDEAESKSKEGVGRATYSTPAFKEDTASKGTATPSGAKDTKSQPSVKSERSEEEEDTSAAGGHREGEEEKASPESTPTKSGKEEKRKRSRPPCQYQRFCMAQLLSSEVLKRLPGNGL
ncbi:unnamed protein product [Durusdinium trenchii]|uniref:Lipase maturation factor 2 n=1 Tax=Durusdinium trenchii TaxID=1381693 RepID=A0ABP0NRJ6_9DINO